MPTAPPRVTTKLSLPRKAWSHGNKSTTQRGYGWEHQKARKRLLKREPLCRECCKHGLVKVATIADHIVNLASGGSQDESNLQPLCASCHREKTLREAHAAHRTPPGAKKSGVAGH